MDFVEKQQIAAAEVGFEQKAGPATDVEMELSFEGEVGFAEARCFGMEAAFAVSIDWLSIVELAGLGTESD